MAKNGIYQFEYMNECSKVDINKVIKWLKHINCDYLIVKHDKDEREPHYHCFVKMKNNRTIEDIAKQVNDKKQYINYIKGFKNALAYAFHLTEKSINDGKYQYDKSAVVDFQNIDIDGIFETAKEYKESKNYLKDLLIAYGECEISKKELMDGLTAKQYLLVSKDFKKMQEYRIMKVRERNMQVVYITGPSGSGKTTLAKYMGRVKNYDLFISGSGKDVLDGYDKEECIILDDLRGDAFTKAELFKLTDNHTNSTVKSRFKNKDISYCKLMIITSIKNPKDLYDWNELTDKDETFVQFARRLGNKFVYVDLNGDILECEYDINYDKTTKKLAPFSMNQVFVLCGIEKKLGPSLMDEIFKKVQENAEEKQKEWDKDLPF